MSSSDFHNLLAIDSATPRLNLALRFGGDRLVKSAEPVIKTHGQVILKKIDELFSTAEIGIDQLQGIIVCLGPGSFTGLRIGLAVAKGLAVGGNLPIVGVTLFDLAAYRLREVAGPISVVLPSRRDEYYCAVVDSGELDAESVHIVSAEELPSTIEGTTAYGIGVVTENGSEEIVRSCDLQEFEYDASDLIQVGLEKFERGELADLADLEPAYLQKAIAEIRFDKRYGKD